MSEALPTSRLGDLATITMGQSPDSTAVNGTGGGLPFLQGCAEFGVRFPQPRFYCSPPLRVAKAGSILISVRAPVGTTNRADQDYCIGRGLGAVLAKPGVADDVFLLHAIEANLEFLHRRSQGSTFLAVGSKELSSLPVPAPEFGVQRRIAEILSTLDEAIEQTEALIAKHQQIKAGLMRDLFTRGVTPDGHLRPTREQAPDLYKESPLGWIPKAWADGPFGKFLIGGPKNGYSPAEVSEWSGFFSLGLGCLTASGFRPRQIKIVSGTSDAACAAIVNDGDLLLSRSNTRELVGLCGIYRDIGGPCIYPDLMMRIKPNEKTSAAYLEALLLSPKMRLQITAAAVGTSGSMVKLNSKSVLRLEISMPKPDEQMRILRIIEAQRGQLESFEAGLSKLRQQKHGLMHDLLTGRVRVPVAETEPAHA